MKEKPFSKYQILANAVMIIWTLAIILPFILLFMSSITDENTLVANGYSFFPKKFSLASYSYIIKSGGQILKAYGVSIGVTVVGTLLNVLLSALMAYPLSVKNLPGRNVMMFFVFFTMLFNGGIVPSYIMWTGTFHIKDTIFAGGVVQIDEQQIYIEEEKRQVEFLKDKEGTLIVHPVVEW